MYHDSLIDLLPMVLKIFEKKQNHSLIFLGGIYTVYIYIYVYTVNNLVYSDYDLVCRLFIYLYQ